MIITGSENTLFLKTPDTLVLYKHTTFTAEVSFRRSLSNLHLTGEKSFPIMIFYSSKKTGFKEQNNRTWAFLRPYFCTRADPSARHNYKIRHNYRIMLVLNTSVGFPNPFSAVRESHHELSLSLLCDPEAWIILQPVIITQTGYSFLLGMLKRKKK